MRGGPANTTKLMGSFLLVLTLLCHYNINLQYFPTFVVSVPTILLLQYITLILPTTEYIYMLL